MIARSFDDGPSSDDLDLDQLSAHSRGALAEFRVPASGSRIRCGLNGITLALHRKSNWKLMFEASEYRCAMTSAQQR